MSFFEPYKEGYVLRIKLAPNASKNAFGADVFVSADGKEYLKACVTAVPEKGKANKEIIKMLSKSLKIAASHFEIISGQTEHLKNIYINTSLNPNIEQKIISLKKER